MSITGMLNDNGLTTIDVAREEFNINYNLVNPMQKLQFKCWINHCESRHKNNNMPFTYHNYLNHMSGKYYLEQVRLNIVNVDDIGGKEKVMSWFNEFNTQ